ncbi:hypothetical protein JCM8097_002307 [Rhodosporidiobolus ruineniae]
MASLSEEQTETFATLSGMGFPDELARRAALRYGSNLEQATAWVLDDPPPSPDLPARPNSPNLIDLDDQPPPLVSVDDDDNLTHPSLLGKGDPPPYAPPKDAPPPADKDKLLPAPFVSPKQNVIDLTASDDFSSLGPRVTAAPPSSPTARLSKGDDDLQRALEASENDDDDLTKAMALSMATLGSTEEEQLSVVDGIKPEERMREDMAAPPILRSISPLQSGLTAYLQSLFASPTWRNAILSYRTPERAIYSGDDYADYWKGDGGVLGMPLATSEVEARENRLIALQRLFVLMTLTRRSFLHVTEVVRAFGIRESDFSHGDTWLGKIKEIHEQLVEDLRIEVGIEVARMLAQGVSQVEATEFDKKAANRFTISGRIVPVDKHIAAPLPPADHSDNGSFVELRIRPAAVPPQTLYSALDDVLVQEDCTPPTLMLTTNVPSTLLFHLRRVAPAVTSLESFGTGAGRAKTERHVFRPTPGTGGEADDIWLDRYHVTNRVRIAEGRKAMGELEGEKEELLRRRKAVGVTQDGRDAREMVRATVEVMARESERAGADEGEGAEGEEEKQRRERQKSLRETWEKVGAELDGVLSSYDSSLTALDQRITSLFDSPEMHRVGPYRLAAIVMRNGLNGRGSAWSVVRGEDGRWWKIVDLLKEEITLEQAFSDPSGLMMDAGSTFLFYQKADEDFKPVPVPAHLERIAHLDNHAFAASLPPSFSNLIASWCLPPLSSLSEAPRRPTPAPEEVVVDLSAAAAAGAAAAEEDDGETVRELKLDSPSPPASASEEEPSVEVMVDHSAAAAAAAGEKEGASGAATPMSVDEAEEGDGEKTQEVEAMRLRGGATVEDADEEDEEADEEGSEYDDDEIDEDEVELGLLAPMPAEWDVDFAVGKVGGLPKWLDPRSPLAPEDVECGVCGRAMSMLLQVNSPDDTRPHAAARSLYVFACRGKDCLSKGGVSQAVRIWRTQMPSPNDFYPHTEETQKLRGALEVNLDAETGLSSRPEKGALKPFPEFDVAAEPEPYEESYLPDPNTPAGEKEEGTEDAAEPDTKTGVDSAFLAFQERIEREPKQVLRFYRLPGIEDPQPLWASSTKIRPEEVSTCELCRGERKVEFQILSTLLPSLEDDYLDFDSLLVYTCTNHCEIPKRAGGKTGWAVEVVFKQDFAAEGVKFGGLQQAPPAPAAPATVAEEEEEE